MDIQDQNLKVEVNQNRFSIKIPNIRCPFGNSVVRICTNPQCASALRCNYSQCQNCGIKLHQKCGFISIKNLTALINEKTQDFHQLLSEIDKIEGQFANSMRRFKQTIVNEYRQFLFDRRHRVMIDVMCDSQGYKVINGAEVQQFCWALQGQIRGEGLNQGRQEAQIAKYKEKMEQIMKELEKQRKTVLFSLIKLQIDSKILRTKGNPQQDISYIKTSLGIHKQIKLLFRASEHNFRADQFHRLCDGIQDTLIIARSQYGRTIAGFTHYKWNHTRDEDGPVNDAERRTFLLQLDLYEKIVPISDKNLIYCSRTEGPKFGGYRSDFGIADRCDVYGSNSYFPCSYNGEGKKYPSNQESYKLLAGAFAFVNYTEYEVFQVVYN